MGLPEEIFELHSLREIFKNFLKGSIVDIFQGRLKFGSSKNSAPFPSMVCIFRKKVAILISVLRGINIVLRGKYGKQL